MKILMAGDIHGDLPHAQYLVKIAKKKGCDRILQLGDFGHWPHYRDGIVYLDQLSLYADLNNILVYWVDGNHDSVSRVYENHGQPEDLDAEGFIRIRKQIRYAPRGHRWIWDGCRFIALGGAWSVDQEWRLDLEKKRAKKAGLTPGAFANTQWFPEEQMTDEDMDKILEDMSIVDVIVAHDKPRAANPGWNRRDFADCMPNQDRLQRAVNMLRPAAFFHGHLHHNYTDPIVYPGPDGGPEVTLVTGLSCNPDAAEYGRAYDKQSSWQVFEPSSIEALRRMNEEAAQAWSSDDDSDDAGQTVATGAGSVS